MRDESESMISDALVDCGFSIRIPVRRGGKRVLFGVAGVEACGEGAFAGQVFSGRQFRWTGIRIVKKKSNLMSCGISQRQEQVSWW